MKTLISNNGSPANMGNIHAQPAPADSTIVRLQNDSNVLSTPSSPGVAVPSEVKVKSSLIERTQSGSSRITEASASDVVRRLSSGTASMHAANGSNFITPTFALGMSPAGSTLAGRYHDSTVPTMALSFTEKMTGLSSERPTIVVLTYFKPLFTAGAFFSAPKYYNFISDASTSVPVSTSPTSAGTYADVQGCMRNLLASSAVEQTTTLANAYPTVSQMFQQRSNDLTNAIAELNDDASFLLNVVRLIEANKDQLDLRHDTYLVEAQSLSGAPLESLTSKSLGSTSRASSLFRYGNIDSLRTLGYATSTITGVYSSTKVWMQMLAELKAMLHHHSLQLLSVPHTHESDDLSPTSILDPSVLYNADYFEVNAPPSFIQAYAYAISSANDVLKSVDDLSTMFGQLYTTTTFRGQAELWIAGLAHLITREYRYSYGLSQHSVCNTLSGFYGYEVAPSFNQSLFDHVIGEFGSNITDFPEYTPNALVSLAMSLNYDPTTGASTRVLTFEPTYVHNDGGSYVPGGDFYFDNVLRTDGTRFNTSNVDHLAAQLNEQFSNLSSLVDGMNLLSVHQQNCGIDNMHTIISDLASQLIDTETGNVLSSTQQDLVCSVYAQAKNDVKLKSMLFLLVLARILAPYDGNTTTYTVGAALKSITASQISTSYGNELGNSSVSFSQLESDYQEAKLLAQQHDPLAAAGHTTPDALVSALITMIMDQLQSTFNPSASASQNVQNFGNNTTNDATGSDTGQASNGLTTPTSPVLFPAALKHALKHGSDVTDILHRFMHDVINQFSINTEAIHNCVSRYSGLVDTVVLMVAFDFAISMIAQYSGQQIVGTTNVSDTSNTSKSDKANVTNVYVVTQSSVNYSNSYNALLELVDAEDNIVTQMLGSILNDMTTLQSSLVGMSNYLSSASALSKLSEITRKLGKNSKLSQIMYTEQQIMLLSSIVNNLTAANNAAANAASQASQPGTTPTPSSEIIVLDQSNVTPETLSALYGFMGSADLASREATNKRILTVGIPLGFTQQLKRTVNLVNGTFNSFRNKRNDLVQIVVYKVDVQNSDIVYKPLRFLFEMSRFPVWSSTAQWIPLPQPPALEDVIVSIPTQNFAQSLDSSMSISTSSGVEYASSAIAGYTGVTSVTAAFTDPSYAFLSPRQKAEVLYNHVSSQLLEVYVELMTGINVAEYNFHLGELPPPIEASFMKAYVEYVVKHAADVSHVRASSASQDFSGGGVLFSTTAGRPRPAHRDRHGTAAQVKPMLSNPAGTAGNVGTTATFRGAQPSNLQQVPLSQQVTGNVTSNLRTLVAADIPGMMSSLRTASTFGRTMTSVSSVDTVNQYVLVPKQFERVFSIIVDADDFEVDYTATTSTPYGRAALELALAKGDIVLNRDPAGSRRNAKDTTIDRLSAQMPVGSSVSYPQGGAPGNVNNYVDRAKGPDDPAIDEYYVTVETFDEGATSPNDFPSAVNVRTNSR